MPCASFSASVLGEDIQDAAMIGADLAHAGASRWSAMIAQ
jgi:hypothetical protein